MNSGYYSYQSVKEKHVGNDLLAKEFMINAEFLGFNAHFPNYNLAWEEWNNGNEFSAKSHFFNASQRYPSGYAWVNYGNLEEEENPNKVQALYEEALRRTKSPEMENNLGIIHLSKDDAAGALRYFEGIESSEDWNDAPLVNKWRALFQLQGQDSINLVGDYDRGNYGVKANILAITALEEPLQFDYEALGSAAPLHRYAYLVNSTYSFTHDSIESLIRDEITNSTSVSTSSTLANALAIHLYNRGEVNKTFRLYDELQANTNEVYKGKYLDALGKLALDQGAFRLAEDFFSEAIRAGHNASRINRLEAYAGQGRNDQIANELLKIIEADPGLTTKANDLLADLETYTPRQRTSASADLEDLPFDELISKANANAFDEKIVLSAVEELTQRDSLMHGYDLLVKATEINPYSVALLKSYIWSATEWNLNEYAEQSMDKLQTLLPADEFQQFEEVISERKEALEQEEWQ